MREAPTTLPRLDGRTIVVTGSRRAVEQSALVSNLGGSPYVVPTVGISIPTTDSEVEPFLRELASPGRMDYAVFMTATGVRTMMLSAERLGLKDEILNSLSGSKTKVVARGGKPRGELAKHAIKVDSSPPREKATASGIVELLKATGLKGAAVAMIWHGSRDESMVTAIREAGAREVLECVTYRYSRGLGPKEARLLGSMG
ncbi:MAG TPA: uroporphyrinogen-III synthase, partial [Nitrososphaerales archaeon]|nr:uroporphyrinogen-III synthase [Nitrososphaerales archaeon]